MQYYSKNASLASNSLFPKFAPFFENVMESIARTKIFSKLSF